MYAAGKTATANVRQLIDGASFGPEALKAIGAALRLGRKSLGTSGMMPRTWKKHG
jgi:hypothetical protein